MRRVNVDTIAGVIRDKDGTAIVIATRGKRQYRIRLPEGVATDLGARLREPD